MTKCRICWVREPEASGWCVDCLEIYESMAVEATMRELTEWAAKRAKAGLEEEAKAPKTAKRRILWRHKI